MSGKEAERRRFAGLALLEKGWSQAKVARHLGVSRAAVTYWVQAYREAGPEGLRARPHPGVGRRLKPRQEKKLERLLLQIARKHGYASELWTLERVAELIERHFGVRYTRSAVWHVLDRMGWSE